VKNVQDEAMEIMWLAMTLRIHVLLWYMKFQTTTPVEKSRNFAEIRPTLLKEFRKSKYKSKHITKLKEIKKVPNETIWDYDHIFKYVMGLLTFHIPNEKHQ
jgi:hypothetical protein